MKAIGALLVACAIALGGAVWAIEPRVAVIEAEHAPPSEHVAPSDHERRIAIIETNQKHLINGIAEIKRSLGVLVERDIDELLRIKHKKE